MRSERLLVSAVALVATYAFFYEYLPPFQRVHLYADIEGYHYPLQRYAFQALKEGRIPQWDAAIYCGISYVGNVNAALFYPPTWLMYAAVWSLPRIPFKAVEAFAFLHVWGAFLLCYLWLRGRAGRLPSAFGASVFACSGYTMWEFWHLGVVCAVPWIPLGLWGIDEAAGRRDWRPLWKVAAASAMSFLAGYPACWIAYCGITIAYALGSREHWRLAARVCGALALSPLLFMVQLLPSMEAKSLMVLEPKYAWGQWGWRTLLVSWFVPGWFDFNPAHPADSAPACMFFYLGLPALFAIAWALWRHQLRPYRQALIGVAFALVLANPFGWLLRIVRRIPALDDVMMPFTFYAGVAAMAASITAISLNDFFESRKAAPMPRWLVPAVVAALAAWSIRQIQIWAHGGVFASRGRGAMEAAIALGLFSLGLWTARAAAGSGRRKLAVILVLATAVDYKVFGTSRSFDARPGDVDQYHAPYGIGGVDDEAYRAMWANRHYRVVTDEEAGPGPTQYRYWGLATPAGFDAFLPIAYRETIQQWVPFRTNRLFDTDLENEAMLHALGVRYVLVRSGFAGEPRVAANPNFRLVGKRDIFCRVYEYLHARPPYHWAHEDSGTVEPTAWVAERREFLVRSERGGRFVLVEQFFPGWKATVDGRRVAIERWGGAFQAIPVAAGEHCIRFEFQPASLRVGAAVSLLAGIALLVVARADGRSRRLTERSRRARRPRRAWSLGADRLRGRG